MVRTVIDKLTEKDYEYWKECMKSYFISEELWEVVTGHFPKPNKEDLVNYRIWKKKNAQALHAIQISCSPDIFSKLEGNKSAKVAWECLALKRQQITPNHDISDSDEGDEDFHQYDELNEALVKPDTEKVRKILTEKPDWQIARISSGGNTVLHAAIMAGDAEKDVVGLVELVLDLVSNEALEVANKHNQIPLSLAAILGYEKIVDAILNKNRNLITYKDKDKLLPIVIVALDGPITMVRHLYSWTPIELLDPDDGYNGATLLNCLIIDGIYDFALDLLNIYPKLGVVEDYYGNNALKLLAHRPSVFASGAALHMSMWKRWIYNCLHVHEHEIKHVRLGDLESIARPLQGARETDWRRRVSRLLHRFAWIFQGITDIKSIHEKKFKHVEARKLLKKICKELPKLSDSQLEKIGIDKAISDAVKNGMVEFIHDLIDCYPNVIWRKDKSGRTIFAHAIIQRQEDIFSLIFEKGSKKRLVVLKRDIFGNNFLHLAAKLSPSSRLERISGEALQMQREIHWYKEIESMVPAKFKEDVNENNKTPKALFSQEHKELEKEAERWMKNTAASCMVVATLIAAVMFTSAFTVPGGNNEETGYPNFLNHDSFLIFTFSNALSLFSSCTSVLMFLGILTSRYSEPDFSKNLPVKLMTGLFTLFFSIVTMMSTFATVIYMSLYKRLSWITIPVIILSVIPVALYSVQQFPLLVEIVVCTCGRGIFHEHRKRHGILHLH